MAPPFVELNGCAEADYVAGKNIDFGNIYYAPRCLSARAGDTVTWTTAGFGFAAHPLQPGIAPGVRSDGPGTAPTPLTPVLSGAGASFTFDKPGIYPYYCRTHESQMSGAVYVH